VIQALRSLYIWIGIAVLTTAMYVVGFPMFVLTMPFDKQRRIGHWYATNWARIITKLNSRWSFQVIGQDRIPQDRPMVVVSNHQGMGDIMVAFCMDLHFKWISKAANFYVPCMGWFMYHAGYIPLHRGNKSSIVQCMARAKRYLDDGVSVLFFPEGTRSKDGEVQSFKPGAFKLAIDAGVDILPIAIAGTVNALPKHTWKFSNEETPMRMLVGETISTRGMTDADVQRLIDQTRQRVVDLKEELEARPLAARKRVGSGALRAAG
jgi:1-acyl-sn-glycerol-3-phosphate acyltransferase